MDSQNVSQSATQLADLGHNDQFKPQKYLLNIFLSE